MSILSNLSGDAACLTAEIVCRQIELEDIGADCLAIARGNMPKAIPRKVAVVSIATCALITLPIDLLCGQQPGSCLLKTVEICRGFFKQTLAPNIIDDARVAVNHSTEELKVLREMVDSYKIELARKDEKIEKLVSMVNQVFINETALFKNVDDKIEHALGKVLLLDRGDEPAEILLKVKGAFIEHLEKNVLLKKTMNEEKNHVSI